MASQIEFFCSEREEQELLEYLTGEASTVVFRIDETGGFTELPDFPRDSLPAWPGFACLYIWVSAYGALSWYDDQPVLKGDTHREFVDQLFDREQWNSLDLITGQRLLDQRRSPGICYKRSQTSENRIGPCTLIAPPRDPAEIGVEYGKWVNRCIGWIRRRGEVVHNYKSPSSSIPNPHAFLNTVYALPDALQQIASKTHSYVIS